LNNEILYLIAFKFFDEIYLKYFVLCLEILSFMIPSFYDMIAWLLLTRQSFSLL